MCNNGRLNLLLSALLLTSACERSGLSPVEIKIDDNSETSSVTQPTNESHEPIVVESAALAEDAAAKDSSDASSKDPKSSTKSDEERKRKEQLNTEFAELMASDKKGTSSKKTKKNAAAARINSNKQEDVLSSPKIIKTASGSDIKEGAAENLNVAKSGKMPYPVKGKIISQFGDVKNDMANDGINIKSGAGTLVKASADGTVIYTGNGLEEEFGNTVIVQHKDDLITSYAHLGNIKVKRGARVKAGDTLGTVGSSGNVTEPQLHFEVMKDKRPVNPMEYLSGG